MIEKFEIIGLFGDRNIHIDFQKDENVKILIGENGTGKTHILNILYYILSGKIEKLKDIEFEKVILKIQNIKKIEVIKQDMIKIDYSLSEIININTLIYLPTYRRVEEDLEKLGLSNIIDEFEIRNNDKFIQFGMDDTERYIQKLLSEITRLSLEGFNEMSGDIINTLIDSNNSIDETYSKTIKNIKTLTIILDRSEKVSENNKKIIIQKVENEEIFNDENRQLFLFLTKLINIYNKQKEKDELIKKFKNICNKYLVDKNFFYNESAIELSLKNSKNNSSLNLNTLSSGEKQLVSIFARIYLACEKDFIIFIDEPEISMSMEWQKMILSDILDSGKCKLLFTTTHSPFIFDDKKGELEEHVVDIVLEATSNYIKKIDE